MSQQACAALWACCWASARYPFSPCVRVFPVAKNSLIRAILKPGWILQCPSSFAAPMKKHEGELARPSATETFPQQQQGARNSEEVGNHLNGPGDANHGAAAAAGTEGGLPQTLDPNPHNHLLAQESSPKPRAEDSAAQDQGSAEAAATLERLRAQNRRHQANHRARVKVRLTATASLLTFSCSSCTHILSTRRCLGGV